MELSQCRTVDSISHKKVALRILVACCQTSYDASRVTQGVSYRLARFGCGGREGCQWHTALSSQGPTDRVMRQRRRASENGLLVARMPDVRSV